jgi:hypothetical protein
VPGGTIGEESSAFPGFEALSHANASPSFGCDMIESPDAARLLEACADWSYHYHVRAVRVFRPSAVVSYLGLYALPCAHIFRVRETTRFICAHRTSSPDLSTQHMHLTPSSSHKTIHLNGTHERSAPCNNAYWLGCVHAQGANARTSVPAQ